MKKIILFILLATCFVSTASARDYYIAPSGSDTGDGSENAPCATLAPLQSKLQPGDAVYFRGGTYRVTPAQSMGERLSLYSCAFILDRSGTQGNPITYAAYPGEQPVFDMSEYRPDGRRVSAFYVSGSWLHIKGLEVTGVQVTITDGTNTQSECFSNRGGSHNIYEDLKMHDGAAIGWYLVSGGDNLVLNCDAWNNYDAANGGGNVDGFGCHPSKGGSGNVLRGCRAWWNSDDGFDLIHSDEAVKIENCWAFYNGYKPGGFSSAADGNGLKAGGYGMSDDSKIAEVIAEHQVTNCIAYRNKAAGFYSNHHLGGIVWINNTAVENRWNYNMVNRKSREEAVDVAGYGHFLANNLSLKGRDAECINLDYTLSESINNTFSNTDLVVADADFVSVDGSVLGAARKADGSLPDVDFMRPTESSDIVALKIGHTFTAPAREDISDTATDPTAWMMAPLIVVRGEEAWVEGPDADEINAFYANGVKLKIRNGRVDLTAVEGTELALKATLSTGVVMTRTITRE